MGVYFLQVLLLSKKRCDKDKQTHEKALRFLRWASGRRLRSRMRWSCSPVFCWTDEECKTPRKVSFQLSYKHSWCGGRLLSLAQGCRAHFVFIGDVLSIFLGFLGLLNFHIAPIILPTVISFGNLGKSNIDTSKLICKEDQLKTNKNKNQSPPLFNTEA